MNEKKMQQVLREIVEEEVSAQSVNLLGRVQDGVQQTPANKPKRMRSWAVGFATLLLVGFVFLTFTPMGRVIADGVLDFFIQEDSDVVNIDPTRTARAILIETEGTPTPNPAFGPDYFPVTEVEAQAGFDVLEPQWVPENTVFKGATFDSEEELAYQHWEWDESMLPAGGAGMFIRQELVTSQEECSLCSAVGGSAIVEEVSFNGAEGQYVIGVWKLVEEGAVWENDPYLQRLRWQVNGLAFEILFMGPPDMMSIDEMVLIAESLQ